LQHNIHAACTYSGRNIESRENRIVTPKNYTSDPENGIMLEN